MCANESCCCYFLSSDAKRPHPPDENREPTAEEPELPEPELLEPELPEPELPEPELLEPPDPEPPVARVPESVTDAAETVPLEPDTPETTIVSPGRMAFRGADSLLVILVAEESLTLMVLPEASVTYTVLPLTLDTVPKDALPPAAPLKPPPAPERPANSDARQPPPPAPVVARAPVAARAPAAPAAPAWRASPSQASSGLPLLTDTGSIDHARPENSRSIDSTVIG